MQQHGKEDAVLFETKPGQNLAKVPGREGYGIALPGPGEAIPYLMATHGRPINRIEELKGFGFTTVIDLGTSVTSAPRHQAETEALGMRYVNIPVTGDFPGPDQIRFFRNAIIEGNNGPILVYAKTPVLLGTMWAAYRIDMGSSRSYAISEAESLGLKVTPGFTP